MRRDFEEIFGLKMWRQYNDVKREKEIFKIFQIFNIQALYTARENQEKEINGIKIERNEIKETKVSLVRLWKYERKIKKNFLYLIAREELFEMKYTYGLMERLNGKGSRGEKVVEALTW